MGAGLNSSMARMRDKATSDLKTNTKRLSDRLHCHPWKQSHSWTEYKVQKLTLNDHIGAFANLCPPLSSVRFSFQVLPKATLNSRPSKTPHPWGGASLAVAPGSRVEKIEPKSLFTCRRREILQLKYKKQLQVLQ